MMEAIPRDYGQGQFDAFCKKVLKNEARAYLRNMKRQRDRETTFSDLPQQEQSILILYCVLDMADGEIASLTGMSRSAVQRHRTKTLKELRVKLMALMPEGG